jgi:hypothetical protein
MQRTLILESRAICSIETNRSQQQVVVFQSPIRKCTAQAEQVPMCRLRAVFLPINVLRSADSPGRIADSTICGCDSASQGSGKLGRIGTDKVGLGPRMPAAGSSRDTPVTKIGNDKSASHLPTSDWRIILAQSGNNQVRFSRDISTEINRVLAAQVAYSVISVRPRTISQPRDLSV